MPFIKLDDLYTHQRFPGAALIKTTKTGRTGIQCDVNDVLYYLFEDGKLKYAHEFYDQTCLESVPGQSVSKVFIDIDKVPIPSNTTAFKLKDQLKFAFEEALFEAQMLKSENVLSVPRPKTCAFCRIVPQGLSMRIYAYTSSTESCKIFETMKYIKERMVKIMGTDIKSKCLDCDINTKSRFHLRLPYALKEKSDKQTYNNVFIHEKVFEEIYTAAKPQNAFNKHLSSLICDLNDEEENEILDDIKRAIIINDSEFDPRSFIRRSYAELIQEALNLRAEKDTLKKKLSKSGATEANVKGIHMIIEALEGKLLKAKLARKSGFLNDESQDKGQLEKCSGNALEGYHGKLSLALSLHALVKAGFISEEDGLDLMTRIILMTKEYEGDKQRAAARATEYFDITPNADLSKIKPLGAFIKAAEMSLPDTEFTKLKKKVLALMDTQSIIKKSFEALNNQRINMDEDYDFENFLDDIGTQKLKTLDEIILHASKVIGYMGLKCFIKLQSNKCGKTCRIEMHRPEELRSRLNVPVEIDVGLDEPQKTFLFNVISENNRFFSYTSIDLVIRPEQYQSKDDLAKTLQLYNRPRFPKTAEHWSKREDVLMVLKHIKEIISAGHKETFMFNMRHMKETIIDLKKQEIILYVFSFAEGVGKSLIYRVLIPNLIGQDYCGGASMTELAKGNNSFAEDKLYTNIDESEEDSGADACLKEHLKKLTNSDIVITDKYIKQKRVQLYCTFTVTSNNATSVPAGDASRRFGCSESLKQDYCTKEYYDKLGNICDLNEQTNPGFASAFLDMLRDLPAGLDGEFTAAEYAALDMRKPLKNPALAKVHECNHIYGTFARDFIPQQMLVDKPDLPDRYIVDAFRTFANEKGVSSVNKLRDYQIGGKIMAAVPLESEVDETYSGLVKRKTDKPDEYGHRVIHHKVFKVGHYDAMIKVQKQEQKKKVQLAQLQEYNE